MQWKRSVNWVNVSWTSPMSKRICEMLLQCHDRKSFLYRIITGDEKWIYFENPKRAKTWVSLSEATPRPNVFCRGKTFAGMQLLLSINKNLRMSSFAWQKDKENKLCERLSLSRFRFKHTSR